MGFYKISEKLLNKAFTEKGDAAYLSTGSYCLDFFACVGGMRYNIKDALSLFMRAFYENKNIAIKILFYIRDIKAGLGERDLFRYLFNLLVNMYPHIGVQLIKYIPVYGRYDDLLICLDSAIKKDVIKYLKETLDNDILLKKENKSISLLAKWLPSINTSNENARHLAKILAKEFGLTHEKYRKTLSFLRKGLILENNLREKDYTFNYETVPGGAMFNIKMLS